MLKELSFTKKSPTTATHEEVAALESKLGVRFPAAFAEFCFRWNGGFASEDNEFYPVPRSFTEFYEEYGPQIGGVLVRILFGVTEKFPPGSLLDEYSLLNEYSNLGIIPVAADLFGNQVVLRADSPTGLVFWRDHELWEAPEHPSPGPQIAERPRLIPIAEDLEFFYNSLTTDPDGLEK